MERMKAIEADLKGYYEEKMASHGPNAMGVGWKNEMAQIVRFDQLYRIINEKKDFSINDLGCGLGDFFEYLLKKECSGFIYRGYDMLESMLTLAREKFPTTGQAKFIQINNSREMETADYTVASGIFNLKYGMDDKAWKEYILDTLQAINEKSSKGFAFNMLTSYSDKEYMQEELYYSDPLFFFDHCKRNYSKNIALLHDYYEYDFTILVRK